MKVTSASPILQVSDLAASLAFYQDRLGFEKEFAYGEPPFYAGVKKDATVFHLCSSHENAQRIGQGSVYVFCDAVDSYYEILSDKDVEITSPLNTYPYGMRDFQIKDPDGNRICFGCPVGED